MQYCSNDSNFLNYWRYCYNQPTLNTPPSTTQLQQTWNNIGTMDKILYYSIQLYFEKYLSLSISWVCLCVIAVMGGWEILQIGWSWRFLSDSVTIILQNVRFYIPCLTDEQNTTQDGSAWDILMPSILGLF